jgi:hypothetical protein
MTSVSQEDLVRIGVPTAVSIVIGVLWDVRHRNLLESYQDLGVTRWLDLHGKRARDCEDRGSRILQNFHGCQMTRHDILEDTNLT